MSTTTAAAKKRETRLTWSQALRRAFGFQILDCPCGGKRKLIAAILDKNQTERILRHVGLWKTAPELGEANDDIVAIRGPPDSFDAAVDEMPGDQFDGMDEPADADWAA